MTDLQSRRLLPRTWIVGRRMANGVGRFLAPPLKCRLLAVRSAEAGAHSFRPISSIELGGILAEPPTGGSREDVLTAWDLDTETPRVLK